MPDKNDFHYGLLSCRRKDDLCSTWGNSTYGKYSLSCGISKYFRGNRCNRRDWTYSRNFDAKERAALPVQYLNKHLILGTRVDT